jgi:hypothetical protein
MALKNTLLSTGFEPANLGSNGKHDNHYTTQNDIRQIRRLGHYQLMERFFTKQNALPDAFAFEICVDERVTDATRSTIIHLRCVWCDVCSTGF